jgi:hypothetical protein
MKPSPAKFEDPNIVPNPEHERSIVDLFMDPEKRERLHMFRERRREQLISALHTTKFLDMSIATSFTVRVGHVANVLDAMKRQGATERCYLISARRDFDTRTLSLEHALNEVAGSFIESILFCPGTKVAYYEGGGYTPHLVLHRKLA